jgi:phosphotransferase system  glucose/maltose/N-acetylglucosamine-specific IIC component
VSRSVLLFVVACALGGLGGLLGSIVGSAAGKNAIVVGGVIGGLLASVITGAVARARRWIPPDRFWHTTIGTAVGFLCAAAIATHTLGSPVGPILSTLLIGGGAVLAAGRRRGGDG